VTPWYTDQEVDDICDGLVNNAAKVRHLRAQGLTVTTDTLPTNTTPVHTNRAALVALFGKQRAAA